MNKSVISTKFQSVSLFLEARQLHQAESKLRGQIKQVRGAVKEQRKAFEKQLAHHAFYDSVTDLPNRALFRDRVNHALATAKRTRQSVAAMFMDLDEFKVVNDSYGHATGDALLKAVAKRLISCVRGGDTVARLGGDEFAVLLEEVTDVAPVEVGERIMRALEAPFRIDGREIHIRASVGIAFANGKEGEAATAIQKSLKAATIL